MNVIFYGIFRNITGCNSNVVEIHPEMTIIDVLAQVCERFPVLQEYFFNDTRNIRPSLPVFINGRNPRLLDEGFSTRIARDDVLSIFSPVSSGRMNVEKLRSE